MLTAINGNLLGYFYTDGYLRTSSKEFSTANLSNRFIHLTNDAIQKNSEDYGKFENANKLSFSDFDRYFAELPHQDYELRFTRDFLPQIRAMVRDTFRSVKGKIDPELRANAFEVFGYDFMIDDGLNLKLIEVNTNPSIEICCPLLARIVPNMLDSVFRLAIDPIFPPNRNRAFSGTEILNDLKMELVFESPSSKRKGTTVKGRVPSNIVGAAAALQ
jgi:tubulin monoglycylase TTLL3/8